MLKNTKSHVPVLLNETVEGLIVSQDVTVIDATLGSGGHFFAILQKLGKGGTLLGIDADKSAITQAEQKLISKKVRGPKILLVTGNFRDIVDIAVTQEVEHADAIVADFGWRMEQFSDDVSLGGGKGFSFTADEPLLMTFGNPASYTFTAADIVNTWREVDIVTILKGYGEERYAPRIAKAILTRRETKPISTSAELAGIVSDAVPARYRSGRIHPATKTFQALRIAVNDELDALQEFISGAVSLLSAGGRLAIISFHSIEDRIVKHTLRTLEENGHVRRITKKPITASQSEQEENPRARSAKLRIVEKI